MWVVTVATAASYRLSEREEPAAAPNGGPTRRAQPAPTPISMTATTNIGPGRHESAPEVPAPADLPGGDAAGMKDLPNRAMRRRLAPGEIP
jgi:hypothetical protein